MKKVNELFAHMELRIDHIKETIHLTKYIEEDSFNINLNRAYPITQKVNGKHQQVALAYETSYIGGLGKKKEIKRYLPYNPFYDPDKEIKIDFFLTYSTFVVDFSRYEGFRRILKYFVFRGYFAEKEKYQYVWLGKYFKIGEDWDTGIVVNPGNLKMYGYTRLRHYPSKDGYYKYAYSQKRKRYMWLFDRYRLEGISIIGTKIFLMKTDDNTLVLEDALKSVEEGVKQGYHYDDGILFLI